MEAISSHNICEHIAFKAIQEAIAETLGHRLGLASIDDIDKVERSMLNSPICDLRNDNELCTFIDNQLRIILESLGYRYDFIQFPVNIRLLHSISDVSYRQKDYNVDSIHCDHWSGSPLDSTNAYMYVRKKNTSPQLVFYSVTPVDQPLIDLYAGAYRDAPKVNFNPLHFDSTEGRLHIFSCKVPHRISRNIDGVTISIDFRLRNKTTLFENDLKYKSQDQWISSRMTSLGVYWKWLNSFPKSFLDKIQAELSESYAYGEQYRLMRSNFISTHYK